jgi:hypothetical protein
MLNYSSIQVTATATATAIARALTTAASGTITEIKSRPWVGEKLTSKTSQEGIFTNPILCYFKRNPST